MTKNNRPIFTSLLVLFLTPTVFSQSDELANPPKIQDTYFFKIFKYVRQPPPPQYIRNGIKQIHAKPKSSWTSRDSLFCAYESVYLQKFGKALNIFTRLRTDTIKEPCAQSLYRVTLHKLNRYKTLKAYNSKTISADTINFYSVKEAFLDMNKAYISFQKGNFNPDADTVFSILQKDTLQYAKWRKNPATNDFVEIAFAMDSVLRQYALFNDKRDPILSKALEEMGDFQKKYFYITNAFFYYSTARFYNPNDLGLGDKYNQSIYTMRDKNYLSLSFKNNFGRIIDNRFGFSAKYMESATTIEKTTLSPTLKEEKERKDYLPWLKSSVAYIIIIAALLLFVLLFLKTKD